MEIVWALAASAWLKFTGTNASEFVDFFSIYGDPQSVDNGDGTITVSSSNAGNSYVLSEGDYVSQRWEYIPAANWPTQVVLAPVPE